MVKLKTNVQLIHKKMVIVVFNTQLLLLCVINKLEEI